jgi:hypothetical protein
MTEARFRIVLAALCLGALACPRPPLDLGPRGRVTDPNELLAALAARRAAVQDVGGDARARIDTPRGGGGLDLFIVAQTPDRVRIEALSFFGQPVAVLTTDGVLFQLADLQHGTFTEGPASATSVSRLLPLELPPGELVSLLLGLPPLLEDAAPVDLALDERERAYVLTLSDRAARQRLGFEPATLRPTFVELPARDGLSGYRAEFDRHEPPADLPTRVVLRSEDGRVKVELSWRQREVNPELDPATFTQQPPEGSRAPGP